MIEALYLHIPFCVSRCAYCDFATSACDDDARMDAYVDALSMQLRRAAKAGLLGAVRTIYIGGGTPTHLGSRRLNSLIYLISLSINLENVLEFTVEANPESLDERMVADLYALGVDRFSVGAQSFDDAVLREYGRVHDAAQIVRAVDAVKTRTGNFSLDLICGGPCQTIQSWEESLLRAIELEAKHVSVYPLALEEGTRMCARVDAGECVVADEEVQAMMMERASELLEMRGFYRYEVASYAKPGCESIHNSSYWTGIEYLGLGAGAASMLGPESAQAVSEAGVFSGDISLHVGDGARVRIAASADDNAFSHSFGAPDIDIETLSEREALLEDLMLGMRRREGVERVRVEELSEALVVFEELVVKGLVFEEAGRFKPTQRGWLMGNEVYGAIWGLA